MIARGHRKQELRTGSQEKADDAGNHPEDRGRQSRGREKRLPRTVCDGRQALQICSSSTAGGRQREKPVAVDSHTRTHSLRDPLFGIRRGVDFDRQGSRGCKTVFREKVPSSLLTPFSLSLAPSLLRSL